MTNPHLNQKTEKKKQFYWKQEIEQNFFQLSAITTQEITLSKQVFCKKFQNRNQTIRLGNKGRACTQYIVNIGVDA